MKILVCGGRNFHDTPEIAKILDQYREMSCLIQGGAKGADRLAKKYAEVRGIPVITMDANWDFYNKAAGPIRNGWMLDFCQPDIVIAFSGGRGTQDMVDQAIANGIPVDTIKPKP